MRADLGKEAPRRGTSVQSLVLFCHLFPALYKQTCSISGGYTPGASIGYGGEFDQPVMCGNCICAFGSGVRNEKSTYSLNVFLIHSSAPLHHRHDSSALPPKCVGW